jgi:hypothetical protein
MMTFYGSYAIPVTIPALTLGSGPMRVGVIPTYVRHYYVRDEVEGMTVHLERLDSDEACNSKTPIQ